MMKLILIHTSDKRRKILNCLYFLNEICKKVDFQGSVPKNHFGLFFICKNKQIHNGHRYVKTISNHIRSAPDFITTVPRGYHA